MNFEVYSYFVIILSGFVAIWMYRHFSKSQSKISEFEYLGWSAFWGLAILISFQLVAKFFHTDSEALINLFGNPFATGFSMSILGLVGGTCIGLGVRDFKNGKKNN